MCSRSSASLSSKCLIQRQPCEQTSKPDALIAAAAGGMRSSASAQPNTVIGRLRSWNSRIRRQKPTRLPYSNMPSPARSRPLMPWPRPWASVSPVSVKPSPSCDRGLRAFLVVHDEIDGDARAVGPARVRAGWRRSRSGRDHTPRQVSSRSNGQPSVTRKGSGTGTNSSSRGPPSRNITTAKRAGRSSTASG